MQTDSQLIIDALREELNYAAQARKQITNLQQACNAELERRRTLSAELAAVNKNVEEISYREMSTILAALRIYQERADRAEVRDMDHFEDCDALTVEEVDELCEKINFGTILRLYGSASDPEAA